MIVKNNIIRNKWSEEHIDYLKGAYLQGCSLKRIADKLNRSVSAINKTLARHNLRTHRTMARAPRLEHPGAKQIQTQRNIGIHLRKKNSQDVKFILAQCRQEVSIEGVIFWLKSQGIFVVKSLNDVYYEVNGLPLNEQQILYKANLLREELHLPIFWVSGVTHL
jgi:IS30 family transposase